MLEKKKEEDEFGAFFLLNFYKYDCLMVKLLAGPGVKMKKPSVMDLRP
jgi:hypothetical protein